MKFSSAFTFHYLIFVSMAMLLTSAKFIRFPGKVSEIKIEKKQQFPPVRENAGELLHGEFLFRY